MSFELSYDTKIGMSWAEIPVIFAWTQIILTTVYFIALSGSSNMLGVSVSKMFAAACCDEVFFFADFFFGLAALSAKMSSAKPGKWMSVNLKNSFYEVFIKSSVNIRAFAVYSMVHESQQGFFCFVGGKEVKIKKCLPNSVGWKNPLAVACQRKKKIAKKIQSNVWFTIPWVKGRL